MFRWGPIVLSLSVCVGCASDAADDAVMCDSGLCGDCRTDADCTSEALCIDGVCRLALDAALGTDVRVDAHGDAPYPDVSDPRDVPATDDGGPEDPGLRLGTPCERDAVCASGICDSGVCCGTHCEGLCSFCGADGACAMPLDDSRCGAISCAGFDTACRSFEDITQTRCASLGTCKTASLDSCSTYREAPADRVCRPEADACDLAETCPGDSGSCPADQPAPVEWSIDPYGACSVQCGGGVQTRSIACVRTDRDQIVPDACCAAPPATERSCNTQACVPPCGSVGAIKSLQGGQATCVNNTVVGDVTVVGGPSSACHCVNSASVGCQSIALFNDKCEHRDRLYTGTACGNGNDRLLSIVSGVRVSYQGVIYSSLRVQGTSGTGGSNPVLCSW